MTDGPIPDRILKARSKWRFTGEVRPHFAETPGPEQESVWDYPRPPRMLAEKRPVRIESNGRTLAETTRAIKVMETASPPTFYLPPADVDQTRLIATTAGSMCEWKGRAAYFSMHCGGPENCAWTYLSPFREFGDLAGYLAFYPGALCCWLGDERVKPQPGGIYGGWVTGELVGPFKGPPGTEWW